jgi:NTE family protein
MKKLKVGLVLGGGGARGLAHVGILKVFQENDIKIDVITGTSIGALIGGLYAQNPDAEWVEDRVCTFIKSDKFKQAGKNYFRHQRNFEPQDLLQQLTREIKKRVVINLAAHRKSLMKGERLKLAVSELIQEGMIEETQIPFACSSTDLKYGETVIFDKGDIRFALTASAAIPGFIPPVESNGRLLVDGSVSDNFPIDAAYSLGAEIIVASNVSLNMDPAIQLDNVIDIIIRSNSVSTNQINKLLLENADYIIEPDTGDVHWSEFDKYDLLLDKGIEAAQKSIDPLKALLKNKNSLLGQFKISLLNMLNKMLL